MYDSTNAAAIPQTAEIVAGYVDGLYRWSDADWARFPNAQKVRIAVLATTNDGLVLDVEAGNYPASAAPGWIRMRQGNGLARPTIYCSRIGTPGYGMADVQAACVGLQYDLWIADWTGSQHMVSGSVATQYASPGTGSGGAYDLSVTNGMWPGNGGTGNFNSGGDVMVLLETIGNRLDLVMVGTDHQVWHRWGDLNSTNESWGAPPGKQVEKVAANFADGTYFLVVAASDGTIWQKSMRWADSSVINDWAPIAPDNARVLIGL
jgi:hypothetical protein